MLHNNQIMRRGFLLGAIGTALGACRYAPATSYEAIDRKSQGVRNQLLATYPNAKRIADQAVAYLIIPEVTKGGLFVGGSYGNGTMYQSHQPVDHYSFAGVSAGLQVGIESYSFAMFYMTDMAYQNFKNSIGLDIRVDAEYALPNQGQSFGQGLQTFSRPVYALVFNQAGLMAGAKVEAAKFTRF